MDISELAAYAKEKYHIAEEHKWPNYPGISALTNPKTGKRLALLIREWDPDEGSQIQRCDIKCGRNLPPDDKAVVLTRPFFMRGAQWAGIIIDEASDRDSVFRLFDRAVILDEKWNYAVTLEDSLGEHPDLYQSSPIPAPGKRFPEKTTSLKQSDFQKDSSKTGAPDQSLRSGAVFSKKSISYENTSRIPARILEMRKLYEYNGDSFEQKCRNFYRQGKFMEDYEDHAPWNGYFRHYFPTYHDLNVPELRGYFTWRTELRKGNVQPITFSFAYIYMYELLCGIGTSSPGDALQKMNEFETRFLDAGFGDSEMRKNLRRWKMEYAILHRMPKEEVRALADPALLKEDRALAVLSHPESQPDEEIFSALSVFEKKLEHSPVIKRTGERGKYYFAACWRHMVESYKNNRDQNFFTACFGRQMLYLWHPLANAVCPQNLEETNTDFALDQSRVFRLRNGMWTESRYEKLYFDKKLFHGWLHETDRLLRVHFKTSHYLKENPEEGWVTPYVTTAILQKEQEEAEAARPKISIDFSSLGQIRDDAAVTRDSLLTEDETDEPSMAWNGPLSEDQSMPAAVKNHAEAENKADGPLAKDEETSDQESGSSVFFDGLDALHLQILDRLLRGKPVDDILKKNYLMPSVVTDTINEALFDEIGDAVLTCDDDRISVVDDYREDVMQLIGEAAHA